CARDVYGTGLDVW
nr:immunoglobulin heavy chain junction region [Macaca mulatta]